MHIALIGASGFVGSALRLEALQRGHQVRALVSNPARLMPAERLEIRQVDVLDAPALAETLSGVDTVISAFSGHAQVDVRGYYLRGVQAIVDAVRSAGRPRLLMVGGAGSLEVAPGVQLVDTPQFPAAWKGTAEGARDALALLRGQSGLAWTMLSPSAHLQPGQRTGRFRLGTDQLLVAASGQSEISVEDFAFAMLDELEHPAHTGQRFTVGY
jgi:putative NADH-flavin reductase